MKRTDRQAGIFQTSGDFIKWVDFNVTCEALEQAFRYDVDTCQAEVHLNWVDLLAYLGTRYGGDFSRYKKSDMKKVAEQLINGEMTMEELTSDMKYYDYYTERINMAEELLKKGESIEEFLPMMSNEKIFEHYLFRSMHKLFIRFFYHAVAITRKRSDKAKFFADFYSHGYCGIIIDWATGGMRETPHDVMLKMRELAYENVTIGEGFRQNL